MPFLRENSPPECTTATHLEFSTQWAPLISTIVCGFVLVALVAIFCKRVYASCATSTSPSSDSSDDYVPLQAEPDVEAQQQQQRLAAPSPTNSSIVTSGLGVNGIEFSYSASSSHRSIEEYMSVVEELRAYSLQGLEKALVHRIRIAKQLQAFLEENERIRGGEEANDDISSGAEDSAAAATEPVTLIEGAVASSSSSGHGGSNPDSTSTTAPNSPRASPSPSPSSAAPATKEEQDILLTIDNSIQMQLEAICKRNYGKLLSPCLNERLLLALIAPPLGAPTQQMDVWIGMGLWLHRCALQRCSLMQYAQKLCDKYKAPYELDWVITVLRIEVTEGLSEDDAAKRATKIVRNRRKQWLEILYGVFSLRIWVKLSQPASMSQQLLFLIGLAIFFVNFCSSLTTTLLALGGQDWLGLNPAAASLSQNPSDHLENALQAVTRIRQINCINWVLAVTLMRQYCLSSPTNEQSNANGSKTTTTRANGIKNNSLNMVKFALQSVFLFNWLASVILFITCVLSTSVCPMTTFRMLVLLLPVVTGYAIMSRFYTVECTYGPASPGQHFKVLVNDLVTNWAQLLFAIAKICFFYLIVGCMAVTFPFTCCCRESTERFRDHMKGTLWKMHPRIMETMHVSNEPTP